MSSIDSAVYTRIKNYAGVSAIVGTRVYLAPVPQNTSYPLVTYQEIDCIEDLTFGSSTSMPVSRYQFDCWASTAATARALADQVFLSLHNYAGTSDSIVIKNSLFDGKRPMDYDPSEGVYRYIVEFLIQWVRT
jgi:hypothetical protein